MCIALAATGIAVLDTATPSGAAPTTSTVTAADAAYTMAAKQRQERRRHNPHGTGHIYRKHYRVYVHGIATDPDNRQHRLTIVLWHNGHRVALRKTHNRHYAFRAHLRPGKNTFAVYARNVGKGTVVRSHLRSRHIWRGWAGHYGGNKRIAAEMFRYHGWGHNQMQSLINLWNRESGWCKTAANSSGAYGIPQALPGSKMSSAGPDWRYNAHTQIRWGLRYIDKRYGSPNNAWAHSQATGWY